MAFENITSDLPPFAIEHDNRHDLSAYPNSREAAAYMLSLPEQGIAGLMYTWVTWEGKASVATCIFGDGIGEKIEERFEEISVPKTMDFYDWQVKGLHMKILEPLVSAEFSFKGKRIELDYHFEAMHPIYPFSSHKNGCPPYYAIDRTEQHGKIKGTLKVDGRNFEFDTIGQRDHAWGPRVWGLNQHYKWFHATTSESAVHFFEMQSFGRVHLRGFVFKDNHMAEIVSVDHEYTFDDEMHHKTIDVVAKDSAGRTTLINCTRFATYQYMADPLITLNESPTVVEIDGKKGAGWCEFCWNKEYLEFAKQHIQYAN
ncbi:MAG: hypothetical protein M0Q95_16840 [Porticoccaceae bacterium]|nr:hypothetical protein [Porticoccaceae bacterium]